MNTSPTKQVDVTGIAGAKVSNVPLKTVAGVIQTTSGPIIGIFHNYAHHGKVIPSIPPSNLKLLVTPSMIAAAAYNVVLNRLPPLMVMSFHLS